MVCSWALKGLLLGPMYVLEKGLEFRNPKAWVAVKELSLSYHNIDMW